MKQSSHINRQQVGTVSTSHCHSVHHAADAWNTNLTTFQLNKLITSIHSNHQHSFILKNNETNIYNIISAYILGYISLNSRFFALLSGAVGNVSGPPDVLQTPRPHNPSSSDQNNINVLLS